MSANEEATQSTEDYVYRISTAEEWKEIERTGCTFGRELDKASGFIHLSKIDQVQTTLKNFFLGVTGELYLLQVDAKKLGDGLFYEAVGEYMFPHFYGPSRSFSPLLLDAVVKAEKLHVLDGNFSCTLLTTKRFQKMDIVEHGNLLPDEPVNCCRENRIISQQRRTSS